MALVPQDITDISYIISERFEKVNTEYIKRMAEHIKYLGKLKPSDMHELEIMARMSVDTKEINEMLAKETGLAINDIYKVYDESGLRAYQDTSVYYEAKGITQIPFSENANMQAYMNSIKEATANTFVNMANTTVIDNTYKTAIDNAIQIISSGYADNNARLRRVIKDNVAGARVTYKSGVTRRLDSACRMNILDGTRRINRGIRKIAGQEFGADGVEIDAHGLCAEDHIDIQGKQYSIKKYELLNSNLKREIGTCNCGHNITYIILGVSKPAWDDDDLRQARQYSTDKVEFKGKEMTRYEASQKMRQMETAMRYKKDEIIGLKTAGYDVTKEEKQLRAIQSNYRQLCNVAELKPRYERAYVPGYRGKGINTKIINRIENPNLSYKKTGMLVSSSAKQSINNEILDNTKLTISKLNDKYTGIREFLAKSGCQFEALDKSQYGIMSIETTLFANKGLRIKRFVFGTTRNSKNILNDIKNMKSYVEKEVKRYYFMPCSKEHYADYLVNHEYGHIVQNYILNSKIDWNIYKTGEELSVAYQEQCKIMYQKLLKIIIDNNFATQEEAINKLSKYCLTKVSRDNKFDDIFAESFANLHSGDVNCWGKAMKIYLKEEGL